MTISRSYRHSFSVPVMLWTTVFLILLARGVYCRSVEPQRSLYPKYGQDGGFGGGYPNDEGMRQLVQRMPNRQQFYRNGEDLSDYQGDGRKLPLILKQIRDFINDGSKEEEKRGSYMSTCPFKICNLG